MRVSLRKPRSRRAQTFRRPAYKGGYRLYAHEVVEIRLLWKYTDLTHREIADHYKISPCHSVNICKMRFWRNI